MSWIKFTSFKTGEVFDSRVPHGTYSEKVGVHEVTIKKPMYEYPHGKDIWIDDPDAKELIDAMDNLPTTSPEK